MFFLQIVSLFWACDVGTLAVDSDVQNWNYYGSKGGQYYQQSPNFSYNSLINATPHEQHNEAVVLELEICTSDGSPGLQLSVTTNEFWTLRHYLCQVNVSTCCIDVIEDELSKTYFTYYNQGCQNNYPEEGKSTFQCKNVNTYINCTRLPWSESNEYFENITQIYFQDGVCHFPLGSFSFSPNKLFSVKFVDPSIQYVVPPQGDNDSCDHVPTSRTAYRTTTSESLSTPSSTTSSTAVTNTSSKINITAKNSNSSSHIIIAAVAASAVTIFLVVIIVLVMVKKRQTSKNSDNNSFSRASNSSELNVNSLVGGFQTESVSFRPAVHGKQKNMPSTASNPYRASVNGLASNYTEIDVNSSSRGDSLHNVPIATGGSNTYATINEAAMNRNMYTSLDERTKYNHLYNKVSVIDPKHRPAMPLPPHVLNQTFAYYSVAQPTINNPTNQNIVPVTPQYIELIEDNNLTNQPVSMEGYLVPLQYPIMVYESTGEPNTYDSLVSTND